MNKTKRKILEKALLSILVAGLVLAITPSVTVFAGWCEDAFGNNNDLCGGPGDDDTNTGSLSFMSYPVNGSISGVKPDGYDSSISGEGDLKVFIVKIVNFALSFLGLIAVIMVIYGGIMYVIAGGESEKAEKGKKNIFYATIGLIIVMGSFALVNTVISAGGGEGNSSGTSGGTIGSRNKDSFNAAAAQVTSLAAKIYDGFDFLAQVTEELKSIRADIQKVSLTPVNLPSKIEVLNYLRSAKSKVEGVKGEVAAFSKTEAYANALIRSIDSSIDVISNLNTDDWIKPDATKYETEEGKNVCLYRGFDQNQDDNEESGWCEKSSANTGCKYSHDEQCQEWGYTKYTVGLMKEWTEIYNKFNSEGPGTCTDSDYGTTDEVELYTLVCPVKTDYYNNLRDYGQQLQDIWDFISVVTAIKSGDAEGYYNLMMKNYFGQDSASTSPINFDQDFSGDNLAENVKNWTLSSSIASAGTYLLDGLDNQYKFRDEILKIQFVKAVLNADVTEGNDPLTVIFDVFDSVDPAGGTFSNATAEGQSIEWDLEGKYMAERLEVGSGGDYEDNATTELSQGELDDTVVECDDITEHAVANGTNPTGGSVTDETDDKIRKTSRRCIYYYPGVYNAAVKINSRNPNLYAPGMSVIPIKINPPKTLINLIASPDANLEDDNNQVVMEYDDSGFLIVNKKEIGFTLSEAADEDGITFTSKDSKPAPKKQKWYFGDGTIMEGNDTFQHQYKSLGKFQVRLEVTNNSGIVDNAIFYVNIADLIANISPLGNKLFVNTPITFDGSGSKSDLGILTQYAWGVTKADGGSIPADEYDCDNNSSGPGVKTYTCTFKKYGDYKTTLTVTNSAGETSEATSITYHVASQLPQAVIEYKAESSSQPSTYLLSGAKSYDPDEYETNGNIELSYGWDTSLDGGTVEEGKDYTWIDENGMPDNTGAVKSKVNPTLKFYKKGVYNVSLTVCDITGETSPEDCNSSATYEKKIDIKKIEVKDNVDIAWGEMDMPEAPTGDEIFAVPMTFKFFSDYVNKMDGKLTYEIDFGDENKHTGKYGQGGEEISFFGNLFASVFLASVDGQQDVVDMDGDGNMTIVHTYTNPDEYTVKLTIYDEDDNDKTITKKIYIPDGKNPYAKANVTVNDVDMTSFECEDNEGSFLGDTKPCAIPVTSKDVVTFDASESINKDGTGKNLRYSWDLGDGSKSTEKTTSHEYSKPKEDGEFKEVTLTVYDKDNPSSKSTKTIFLELMTSAPEVSSVIGLPDISNPDQKAPLKVNVKAYGATDKDGEIIQYKWFYYKAGDYHSGNETEVEDANRLGAQLTKTPETQLTIGSWNGDENEPLDFGVGVELKDNDGKTTIIYSLDNEGAPITVKNGANKPPVAKFTTGKTKVMVNEEVLFSSFSSDSDGRIVKYTWDFGDGESVSGTLPVGTNSDKNYPQAKHVYKKKNLEGYKVVLSLEDDGGSSATSDPVTISVDSPIQPPVAAFTIRGAGKKVCFDYSTSKADSGVTIIDAAFDFDKNVDSDGDGVRDNDIDYSLKEGKSEFDGVGTFTTMSNCSEGNKQIAFEYNNTGTYDIKLTVTDEEGNVDDVTNKVTLPLGNPPIAGFTYKIVDDEVQFTDTSTATEGISEYVWDFNTAVDSSGDGVKDNDVDSSAENPDYKYSQNGEYKVKLTVTDENGNTDSVVNSVEYEKYVPLDAILLSVPPASYEGIVYLIGTTGTVSWDFSKSLGKITEYIIDKNIYYAGDVELKFTKPGTVSVIYDKSWGKIATKLTIKDAEGNSDSTTLEVQFK